MSWSRSQPHPCEQLPARCTILETREVVEILNTLQQSTSAPRCFVCGGQTAALETATISGHTASSNQAAATLLVDEGEFPRARKHRGGQETVDKIKPLLTSTATAPGGRKGHAQSSEGILDFVAKQHKTDAAKFLVKKTLAVILVFLSLSAQWVMAQATGSIQGAVTDSSGLPIFGAVVAVEGPDGSRSMTVTDGAGAFKISSLTLSNYSVKISAAGFSDWSKVNVAASATPESNPVLAVLQVAPEVRSVTVRPSTEELAAEQVTQQLKQRVLGVIPNYYVSYEQNPAPLSSKQKFRLGLRTLVDPFTFAAVGITAGIQQTKNSYWQYGQGTEGFAKRFGAAYLTASSNLLITSALASSVLHQDPRYFYSGRGTKAKRAWYAIESSFRAKGNNGKWQPPYSSVIGTVAAAEFSEVYYPGSRTQYSLLGRSLMFHFGGLVAVNLAQELLLKKLTHNVPDGQPAAAAPVLPEGKPVPLIAVDGFSAEGAAVGQPVTFVLAEDLTVLGKVVARTGDVASGQVTQVAAGAPGDARSIALQRVMLRAGNVNVPLRSSQVRGGADPVQYKELPGSGKVKVTLFVAQSVQFPDD
jgi:hypothetical protein